MRLSLRSGEAVPSGTEVRLINASGQLVSTTLMRGNNLEVSTTTLPAGLYFLMITDETTFSWTGKVIKR